MFKNNSNHSSRLFLMELIFAILFFSLGSAVCVQAFAKAHLISVEARDLAFASSTVSSAASVVRFSGGEPEPFRMYFPEAVSDENGALQVWYGEDFVPCGEDEAVYVLRVETKQEGVAEDAHICMYNGDGGLIYELSLRWPAAVWEGGI